MHVLVLLVAHYSQLLLAVASEEDSHLLMLMTRVMLHAGSLVT